MIFIMYAQSNPLIPERNFVKVAIWFLAKLKCTTLSLNCDRKMASMCLSQSSMTGLPIIFFISSRALGVLLTRGSTDSAPYWERSACIAHLILVPAIICV